MKRQKGFTPVELILVIAIIGIISAIVIPLTLEKRTQNRVLRDLKAIHPEVVYIVAINQKSVVRHYVVVVKNQDDSYSTYEIDQK